MFFVCCELLCWKCESVTLQYIRACWNLVLANHFARCSLPWLKRARLRDHGKEQVIALDAEYMNHKHSWERRAIRLLAIFRIDSEDVFRGCNGASSSNSDAGHNGQVKIIRRSRLLGSLRPSRDGRTFWTHRPTPKKRLRASSLLGLHVGAEQLPQHVVSMASGPAVFFE